MAEWLEGLTQERQRREESLRTAEEQVKAFIPTVSADIDQVFQDVLQYVQEAKADNPLVSYLLERSEGSWSISNSTANDRTFPWISVNIGKYEFPYLSGKYRALVDIRERGQEYEYRIPIEDFSLDNLKGRLLAAVKREVR